MGDRGHSYVFHSPSSRTSTRPEVTPCRQRHSLLGQTLVVSYILKIFNGFSLSTTILIPASQYLSYSNSQADSRPLNEDDAGNDGIWWTSHHVSIRKPRASNPLEHPKLVRVKRCTHCRTIVLLGDGTSLHAYDTHFKSEHCLTGACANKHC